MICLWGFLLLAVATSSVDSQCVASMTTQNADLIRALQNHISFLTNVRLPAISHPVSSVINTLTGLVTSITDVGYKAADVISAGIHNTSNGLEIRAVITIIISCKEFSDFEFIVYMIVPVDMKAVNGCAQMSMLDGKNMTASINGLSTQLSSAAVDTIVKALLTQLSSTLNFIFNKVIEEMNNKYKGLKAVFTIGNKACRYYITGVTKQGMNAVVNLTTTIENETLSWQNVGNFNLTENKTIGWNLDQRLLNKVIGVALSALNFKINIANGLLANIFWLAQNGGVSLQLNGAKLMNATLSGNGVGLNVNMNFSLMSNSVTLASGTVFLFLTGQPAYRNGWFGVNASTLSVGGVFIDAIWVNAMDANCTCGGGDKTRAWLTNLFLSNLNSLIAQLNRTLREIFLLPFIFGNTGNNGECKAKTDYVQCKCF